MLSTTPCIVPPTTTRYSVATLPNVVFQLPRVIHYVMPNLNAMSLHSEIKSTRSSYIHEVGHCIDIASYYDAAKNYVLCYIIQKITEMVCMYCLLIISRRWR